jgi:protease-4
MRMNFFRKRSSNAENADDPATAQLKMMQMMVRDRQQDRRFRLARLVVVALVPSLLIWGKVNLGVSRPQWLSSRPELGIVRIAGTVGATGNRADTVVPALKSAFLDPRVKVVALLIDSGGGSPIDAERIDEAMAVLKHQHPKRVVAIINSVGASAAYLIAMHADEIIAGRFSLVGSIGAVIDSWDLSGALSKVNIRQRVYASGDLKAMLNPFIPSTELADEKAQALVNVLADEFLSELKKERGNKLLVGKKYDTGEVWDGQEAHRIGLVDTIGTVESLQASLQVTYPDLETRDFGPVASSIGTGITSEIQNLVASIVTPALR